MASLYIVATPIGNLEDITLRALRILREADVLFCEDTRVTSKLLSRYEIKAQLVSYHAHSPKDRSNKAIKFLREGKSVALVSDAGTPTISDPGILLVQDVRQEFGDEVEIIPIPGASALISALSISGITSKEFIFLGFLPHKKGRETLFKEIKEATRTIVFYESSHRILKTLNSLQKHFEGNTRKVVVAREITKIYEECVQGSADYVLKYYEENSDKVRGEFVVVIEGKQ